MNISKDKILYVLGAGFSIEAGAPSQESIVGEIFSHFKTSRDLKIIKSLEDLRNFLSNTMQIKDDQFKNIPLEDILTPLDRCLIEGSNFRDLSCDQLENHKSTINYLIASLLSSKLENPKDDYISEFANFLVEKAKVRALGNYKNIDQVSVISMNWDILLDNNLKKSLDKIQDIQLIDKLKVVDYCTYVSSFEEHDNSIRPGLEALGSGGFNIKLLKLHGSLNWLSCPRCFSLFIGFYEKIGIHGYYNSQSCRHCNSNYKNNSSKLRPMLVMPTFLKNLNTPQLKLIWNNAGVEFSEAKKIVFIGYSLPQADFELRQLMARMVRDNAEIEVVDFKIDRSLKDIEDFKRRYETFFGKRNINFFLGGARKYVFNKLS